MLSAVCNLTMPLTESIVPPMRDAALTYFRLRLATARHVGELGYAVRHGPQIVQGEHAGGTLTPPLSQMKRESYGEVALVERLREAFWHLIPAALGSRNLVTLRGTLLPKLLRGELTVNQ